MKQVSTTSENSFDQEGDLIIKNIELEYRKSLNFSNRLADRVASFGGSWNFIIIFLTIVLIWIFLNSLQLLIAPFDPYPFILLNLVLSCIAGLQAPFILMSQNAQIARDRLRSENDYKVNIKAEQEIRVINSKLDELIQKQAEGFIKIQKMHDDLEMI